VMTTWAGEPGNCDLCNEPIKKVFVDGRIAKRTSWAKMCISCYAEYGAGLGTGSGQLYNQIGKEWRKVQG
jgi:hypothetical protein